MPMFPPQLYPLIGQDSRQTKDQKHLLIQLGDGHQTRLGLGTKSNFDQWILSFTAMTTAQFTILHDFYKTVGIILPFEATMPDRPTANYVFTGGLSVSDNGVGAPYTRYNVECTILQVDYSEL